MALYPAVHGLGLVHSRLWVWFSSAHSLWVSAYLGNVPLLMNGRRPRQQANTWKHQGGLYFCHHHILLEKWVTWSGPKSLGQGSVPLKVGWEEGCNYLLKILSFIIIWKFAIQVEQYFVSTQLSQLHFFLLYSVTTPPLNTTDICISIYFPLLGKWLSVALN